nr:hypothetical protein [Tanacetum cinerariifolium]
VADEPASPVRDDSQGEACATDSGFIAGQYATTLNELTAFCTSLQRQHLELLAKFQAQEVEINRLKERVKILEDKEGVIGDKSGDNSPIKGRSPNEGEAPAERISNDSEEIARVLTSIDAATILAGEANVPTGSGFIPTAEQQEREDVRINEQIARDAEVARIHAEEEILCMIDSLDKSNETVAKYLQEYQQFASDLSLEKKIELISNLVKYQEHYAKVYKFQSQQRKLMSKKQKRVLYGYFTPMGSKEEAEIAKRKGIILEKEQIKKQKSSEEAPESKTPTEEVSEDKIKEMM